MTETGRKSLGRRIERQESRDGHDGMNPQVVRELIDKIMGLLIIIFEGLWRSGVMPENWKKEKVQGGPRELQSLLSWRGDGVPCYGGHLPSTVEDTQDKKVTTSSQH